LVRTQRVLAGRDPLRAGEDLVEVSLMASRARSAAVRIAQASEVDDVDRLALGELADYLEEVADSVDFFASGGTAGAPPLGAFTANVDATVDAAMERPGQANAQVIADRVRELADASRALEKTPDKAVGLAEFLAQLSVSALRQVARSGETTSTF
jgi:hypothetical protein